MIEVDELIMETQDLQSQRDKFTLSLESKMANTSDKTNYTPLGNNILEEWNALLYGDELVDAKVVEIDKP